MLERLSIKNIALIRSESIEFTEGFNVITGETGAGKSLVVDSLSLLLGEKADRSLISRGEDSAYVEAVFTSLKENVLNRLEELGLEREEPLVISRKITANGKNECRVNGRVFTLSMLKQITGVLMDLHGQFEHQNLLKVSSHIQILDKFAGAGLQKAKEDFLKSYHALQKVKSELMGLVTDERERARLVDLYSYQISEIDEAAFYEGEEEELKDFRNRVLHEQKVLENINGAISIAKGENFSSGASDYLKKMSLLVSGAGEYVKGLDEYIERLDSLKIELDDIVEGLEDFASNMYFDEGAVKKNEERIDLLSSFKKKYGSSISEINEYRREIGDELFKLTSSIERLETLSKEKEKLLSELTQKAKVLSSLRREAAKNMQEAVGAELSSLSMTSARFVIEIVSDDIENVTPSGVDRVEFMFSANKGEALKPLKSVASGGEMSRFMLATQNITAKIEGISTLVFDEIDTGVSGHVATVLGEKLLSVSRFAQVICVTHLSQVAAFANSHHFIEKFEKDNKTLTRVTKLDSIASRARELARISHGGISESALRSSEELLLNAKKFEESLS